MWGDGGEASRWKVGEAGMKCRYRAAKRCILWSYIIGHNCSEPTVEKWMDEGDVDVREGMAAGLMK
jgi:hypothetical protein